MPGHAWNQAAMLLFSIGSGKIIARSKLNKSIARNKQTGISQPR